MKNFDNTSLKLNNKHRKLAELLVSLHITKSSYTQIPTYHYSQCKKGITCSACDSFSITVEGRNCRCLECGQVELVESAVLRIVEEIKMLFPDMKITTNLVHEWCCVVGSKKRISRILEKNFKIVGVHQWAFYE